MVATNCLPTQISEDHTRRWRLIASCATVERAEQTVQMLRARGVDATLSMINGLSVIAR